jgi:hypothetical protein
MGTVDRIKRRRAPASSEQGLGARDLLLPIFTFLKKSGLSEVELLTESRSAIRNASRTKSKLKVVRIGFASLNTNIVGRWLRDPNYLNHAGRPADLPRTGARSFTSLVRDCELEVSPSKALALLIEIGNVRKVASGNYRLVRRSLDFAITDYLPFEPNLKFLVDAAKAATRGLGKSQKATKLFWITAENSQVQGRHSKEFLRFAEQRGLSFTHEINDWLEQHKHNGLPPGKAVGKSKRLGMGVFGICSDFL